MMDAIGVDAAVLISPTLYGANHSYSFDAANRYPGRFGVVGPLDPGVPDVEDRVRTFRHQQWGIGVRVILLPGTPEPITGPGYRTIFAAAEKADVPIFLTAMGLLHEVPSIASQFPNLLIVLDHLGLSMFGSEKTERLAMLPHLTALAVFDNVAVKCTATPELSSEAYPYRDLWPHLHRVIDAFGPRRVMWGTNINQHYRELTYCEALDYMRRTDELSEAEKELILGGTARTLLRWPIATTASTPVNAAPPR